MSTCMDNAACAAQHEAYYNACKLVWYIWVPFGLKPPSSVGQMLMDYVSIGLERIIVEAHIITRPTS
jgi:hypothetical protein